MNEKLIFALKASAITPFIWFIERYVFNDWDFLITLALLVLADAIIIIALTFANRGYLIVHGLRDFTLKTFALAMTVICLSIIDLALIKGEGSAVIDFINSGFYSVMLGFMFASILKNLHMIYPWDFIEHLLDTFNLKKKKKIDGDY